MEWDWTVVSLTNTLLTDEATRLLTEGPQQPCFKENWVWKVLRSMAECPAGSESLTVRLSDASDASRHASRSFGHVCQRVSGPICREVLGVWSASSSSLSSEQSVFTYIRPVCSPCSSLISVLWTCTSNISPLCPSAAVALGNRHGCGRTRVCPIDGVTQTGVGVV